MDQTGAKPTSTILSSQKAKATKWALKSRELILRLDAKTAQAFLQPTAGDNKRAKISRNPRRISRSCRYLSSIYTVYSNRLI